jgi:hypothetical protein
MGAIMELANIVSGLSGSSLGRNESQAKAATAMVAWQKRRKSLGHRRLRADWDTNFLDLPTIYLDFEAMVSRQDCLE